MQQLDYKSIAGLVDAAQAAGEAVSAVVLRQQAAELSQSEEQVYQEMLARYRVMAGCIGPGCAPDLKSTSGLTGGGAFKVRRAVEAGRSLTGSVLGGALYRALAVSELNAAMGRVVAAPTAGSCGILPAAVLTMQAEKGCTERACVLSLFTASAVGMVIASTATLAGAEGGCQAECGSPAQLADAVAIALKNVLGLVCDPVAGLVEIPCIKRNASGVAGAFVAAELALAGMGSAIPADEVIWAMKKVGEGMPAALKETAEGGLAATPTARALHQQVFGHAPAPGGCSACSSCPKP